MRQTKAQVHKLERSASVLKALSHPVRLCIVKGLVENGGSNVGAIQDCLGIPQSTVSQHLSILRAAGILEGVRHGVSVEYTVVDPLARKVIECIDR